jgi:hypothetical protein
MSKDKQLGQALLHAKVQEFNSALAQAEAIADEYGLEFSIEPAYGMGGYYEGTDNQWYASSESC